jgi:transcription-repair coupling factor (superfamily II helicase)
VGYGKTEIAIRAAFKAVQENKQVAYLAPTTILAQQIYDTFSQRMKDYPVRVDLLCRFRSTAEQKKTIADLKKGQVDIVVGTHRVLSKDVGYKDLGLLVVDEEQRFGVTHKEKIKQLKTNVDVLTLTATPIPRTLHMSLIGIRDMSVLEEPPMDRVPIQTYVLEYNEELVREAINRELARDGQVYYVYNRVKDIADVAAKLQSLVPDANIAFAHGQMRETQLEDIMYRYRCARLDHYNRDRHGYFKRKHNDNPRRRQYGAFPALPASRPRGALKPDGVCVPYVQAQQNAKGGCGEAACRHTRIFGSGKRL